MGDGLSSPASATRPRSGAAGLPLGNWKDAERRACAYLAALGVDEPQRSTLAREAVAQAAARPWTPESDAIVETLDALRALVVGEAPGEPEDAFLRWRLDRAVAGTAGDGALPVAPPLSRRPMGYEPVHRWPFGRLREAREARAEGRAEQALWGSPLRQMRRTFRWTRAAHLRRTLLVGLVLVPTTIASLFMAEVLPQQGQTWLELAIVVFFGVLFGWVSIGFWTALFGFFIVLRGRDRFAITGRAAGDPEVPPAERPEPGPIAILMPICNEPVDRVFAGLAAIHRSLERAGAAERFHVFILSDTADPDVAMQEEEAWFRWCREVRGFGRIFYRRRRIRIERKSGNVSDFCRRWGARYRYMVTLDADSVMAGSTILRLVELMDAHPHVGMIQTAPTAVNRRSLFARVQQFSSRVYGPMFAAGLHWWQLGDGQYWGHNTIIRVAPFMAHCGLPRLSGREPLGGEILSHDFVEAALMGRAGWSIWLAYDLGGSWEEVPSTLLEEMKRDRRWCQGNLQHLRLLPTEGLFGAHRALFLNGVFSYVSAVLWFAFLSLSTVEAIDQAIREPEYFPHGRSLFPEWPVWRPEWAYSLLAVTGILLFLPKLLSILLIVFRSRQARQFGGVVRLTLSVLIEIVVSSLLAPIRMVFHTRFVLTNVIGRTVAWKSGSREDAETSWLEANRHHALDSIVASAWGAGLYWLNPGYFWWVTPIIGALILSIPSSVVLSRVGLGDLARRLGLFLIPEEHDPPQELRDLVAELAAAERRAAAVPAPERSGFVRAVVDPALNAVHRVLLRGPRRLHPAIRAGREALVAKALADGPAALGPAERRVVLLDPQATDALHVRVWAIEDRERAARWGRPGGVAAAPPA